MLGTPRTQVVGQVQQLLVRLLRRVQLRLVTFLLTLLHQVPTFITLRLYLNQCSGSGAVSFRASRIRIRLSEVGILILQSSRKSN